jgi:type I restriction enzyme M protein
MRGNGPENKKQRQAGTKSPGRPLPDIHREALIAGDLVRSLWGFCHTLRHDGIDYGEYIEQITYLLFIKMADEKAVPMPGGCTWPDLTRIPQAALPGHYAHILQCLGEQAGLLGEIFSGARSRFNTPENLEKLIHLIDETEWTALGVDVKATVFEELLEKAVREGKKGAGQYFTPRPLIQSIVRCIKPDPREKPGFTICDPACGTGGFLVCSSEWLMERAGHNCRSALQAEVKYGIYYGQELVERPRRLALMNLSLYDIVPLIVLGDSIYEKPGSLKYDVVVTNPPFGTKGANQSPSRKDFPVTTSNKQLNFVQHVITILKPGEKSQWLFRIMCSFLNRPRRYSGT